MTRAVILDRDGTINVDRPDFVKSLDELVIIPGAPEAISRLCAAGLTVLVATNQSCIGRGLITSARLDEINHAIDARVSDAGGRIAAWYICPHTDADGCDCRKPRPGLALRAQREWGFDPAATWSAGDAERDADMARGAGCRPALVLTGKGLKAQPNLPGVPAFADLAAFAEFVASPG
jgi:D-glycero-D-manno-heptose 1,7-bisphosphate phosphatase